MLETSHQPVVTKAIIASQDEVPNFPWMKRGVRSGQVARFDSQEMSFPEVAYAFRRRMELTLLRRQCPRRFPLDEREATEALSMQGELDEVLMMRQSAMRYAEEVLIWRLPLS